MSTGGSELRRILSGSRSGTSFFRNGTAIPRYRKGKEAKGRCLHFSIFMSVFRVHLYSTGHICERRIHFFNVIRQCIGDRLCWYIFESLYLSDDPYIYMTFLQNYVKIFLLFLQNPMSILTRLRTPKTVFKSLL